MTKENEPISNSHETGQESNRESQNTTAQDAAAIKMTPRAPSLELIEKPPRFFSDVLRALLIILAIIVAAGFVLIILPQPTVDKMTQDLRARQAKGAQPEQIAFLYVQDKLENNNFHLRGVIRNISSTPINKLEAAVRLYLHDETVHQTTILPMDKEVIAPDEIAQFDLVYPNYKMQFQKYSVEFKFQDGNLAPYKDMRTTKDQPPDSAQK